MKTYTMFIYDRDGNLRKHTTATEWRFDHETRILEVFTQRGRSITPDPIHFRSEAN